jgi:hypothetical protein
MTTTRFALLFALLASFACKQKDLTTPESARTGRDMPLSMNESGRSITAAPDRARVKADIAQIRSLILQYQRLNEGKNPASISDLPIERVFYPNDVDYNPETGEVHSKTYPEM